MDGQVLVAMIAAGASVVVAVVSAFVSITNRRNAERFQKLTTKWTQEFERSQQKLVSRLEAERLRLSNNLEEQRAVGDARRDYEYEARKRLYQECEPLLFRARELAEAARGRIASLARSAKSADLRPDGSGWLANPGYYLRSTIYMLFAPTTTVKLLQRRLTLVDLSLEPRLEHQYELLKSTYQSWTEDFKLAKLAPELPYDPDRADPGKPERQKLLETNPACFRRQGIYVGTLEVLSECLLVEDASRCKSFGEFQQEWDDDSSSLHRYLGDFIELFDGFHPSRFPVLWRLLVLQYLEHSLLLASFGTDSWGSDHVSRVLDGMTIDLNDLDWRAHLDEATDESVVQSLELAREYIEQRFAS